MGFSGQRRVHRSWTHWAFMSGNRVCFPWRSASLQRFTSRLLDVFIMWSLVFGGLTSPLEALTQMLLLSSAAEIPFSHKPFWLWWNFCQTSAKCQTFQERNESFFSVFTFTLRQFGVYLLGFRRISSDEKLKDPLGRERIKKIFQSNLKNVQHCCYEDFTW